jgi:UDP-glucose 4-epimerase
MEVDMLAQTFLWRHPEVQTVVLRPCHILGKVKNAPSNYLRVEHPITIMGFDPMVQVVHELDVTHAIGLALEPGRRGVYNLRGPGELPLSKAFSLLGKKPWPMPAPIAQRAINTLFRSRLGSFPAPEIDHIRYLCMVDDSLARRELGYEPRYDMRSTLEAVFEPWQRMSA